MIRTVNYRDDVIFAIAGLLHVDARDLSTETARTWAQRINSWVRKGWDYWQFKDLEVTEERALRQVWFADQVYQTEAEVYHLPSSQYYRATAATLAGEEPTISNKWLAIAPTYFLELEQYGSQAIGQVLEVYPADPRTYRYQTPWLTYPFRPSPGGVEILTATGNTVWLRYKVRQPKFTADEYDPAAEYLTDQLVYDPASGDCFVALKDGVGQALSDELAWYKQELPYCLSEYVACGAASDLCEDIRTKPMHADAAEEAIAAEINKEGEQGGFRNFYTLRQRAYGQRYGWCIPYQLISALCVA